MMTNVSKLGKVHLHFNYATGSKNTSWKKDLSRPDLVNNTSLILSLDQNASLLLQVKVFKKIQLEYNQLSKSQPT